MLTNLEMFDLLQLMLEFYSPSPFEVGGAYCFAHVSQYVGQYVCLPQFMQPMCTCITGEG